MRKLIILIAMLPLVATAQTTALGTDGGPADIHVNPGQQPPLLSVEDLVARRMRVPEYDLPLYDLELSSAQGPGGAIGIVLGLAMMAGGPALIYFSDEPSNAAGYAGSALGLAGGVAFTVGILRGSHKREARRRATWLYYSTNVWHER